MAKYAVTRADGTDGTPVPADEPCFVIRAQDAFAVRAVEAYMELTRQIVSRDFEAELDAHLERIIGWQIANPGAVKLPD